MNKNYRPRIPWPVFISTHETLVLKKRKNTLEFIHISSSTLKTVFCCSSTVNKGSAGVLTAWLPRILFERNERNKIKILLRSECGYDIMYSSGVLCLLRYSYCRYLAAERSHNQCLYAFCKKWRLHYEKVFRLPTDSA